MKKFEDYKSEEILSLRIKNKIDTIDNWVANGSEFAPLDGEIIIAVDESTNQKHILIGDGDKTAQQLVNNRITDEYIKGLFETNS